MAGMNEIRLKSEKMHSTKQSETKLTACVLKQDQNIRKVTKDSYFNETKFHGMTRTF